MPPAEKPRHRSGYGQEEFEQVKAACLTVAVTLGAYLDDVCIVGGLVPALLIDSVRDTGDDEDPRHPGTNDLDIGLALALLDDERYTEISARLRAEGFAPDTNDAGKRRPSSRQIGWVRLRLCSSLEDQLGVGTAIAPARVPAGDLAQAPSQPSRRHRRALARGAGSIGAGRRPSTSRIIAPTGAAWSWRRRDYSASVMHVVRPLGAVPPAQTMFAGRVGSPMGGR